MTVEDGEPTDGQRSNAKSAAAFRTISEVADDLDVLPHVLRFWETKFSEVRPLKRGGGRRYYRPEDIALLRRIRGLLHNDGYTIKGVQRLLRDGGGKLPPSSADMARADAVADASGDREPEIAAVRKPGDRDALVGLLDELRALRDTLDTVRRS